MAGRVALNTLKRILIAVSMLYTILKHIINYDLKNCRVRALLHLIITVLFELPIKHKLKTINIFKAERGC